MKTVWTLFVLTLFVKTTTAQDRTIIKGDTASYHGIKYYPEKIIRLGYGTGVNKDFVFVFKGSGVTMNGYAASGYAKADCQKSIERSASYPSITLEHAVQFAANIARNFPSPRQFDRDDVQAIISKASRLNRDVAACVHFGLFARKESRYFVTDVLKKIQNPLSDSERLKTLKECFGRPKLYRELIANFDGRPLPSELRIHLIRFHSIIDKAAQTAADIFIESGKYCGAITPENVLDYEELTEGGKIEYAQIVQETPNSKDDDTKRVKQQITHELPPAPEDERIRIPLTGGKSAYLSYPKTITAKDVEILNKQIELIGLVVS